MTFARQFVIYGIAGALSRLASFLLVPLYTRTLSQQDYGRLEVVLSVYMLSVLLIGLQGESAVARDYFAARKEGREREIVWGALAMAVCGLLLTTTVAAAATWWGAPSYLTTNAALLLAAAAFTQIAGVQLVVIRFAERPAFYAALSLVDVIVTALSSLVMIVWLGMGLAGALAGLLLGKAAIVALAWPGVIGMPRRGDGSGSRLRAMAAYSLPTMPAVILNWLQTIGNRIVWSAFFPLGIVAVASVGMRVAAAFGLVVYAFRLAWEPFAFRLLDEEGDAHAAFSPVLAYVALGSLVLAGAATLAGPLLAALFAPPAYGDAAALIGILMMSQAWLMVALVTPMGIHGARVTSRLTWIYVAGVLANLAVLAGLSPFVGLMATAWGTFAGAVVIAVGGAWFSNRHFGTGFSFRLLGSFVAATVAIGWVVVRYPAWGGTLWPHPATVFALGGALAVLWFAGMEATDRSNARRVALQQFKAFRWIIHRGPPSGDAERKRGIAERDDC